MNRRVIQQAFVMGELRDRGLLWKEASSTWSQKHEKSQLWGVGQKKYSET